MKNFDWSDPYYECVTTGKKAIPIIVDVTTSIPNFPKPVVGLSDISAKFKDLKYKTILDFGAGKLRNSIYLLDQGFTVYAVEYKEAFETGDGKKYLAQAQSYNKPGKRKKFFYLQYPDAFLNFNRRLDAVLIVNVVSVIPYERERRRIIRECAARHKKKGLMLLMAYSATGFYGPGQTKRVQVEDGWCYNLHKDYKSFNHQFDQPELESLVPTSFYKRGVRVTAKNHHAMLYERK